MPVCIALFMGTVFMLYVAKIPKRGTLTYLGVIGGILLFITGMFWMMSLFFVLFGIAADCICASGHFRSFKKNLSAYRIMALAPFRLWSEKFGIRILEGYGVTEASPVVGVNTMGHYRFGSVGRLLPGMACRLV